MDQTLQQNMVNDIFLVFLRQFYLPLVWVASVVGRGEDTPLTLLSVPFSLSFERNTARLNGRLCKREKETR
jgi:hypothetical protein